MRALENLELHLVHGCNLACEGCSHFSDQGPPGRLSLREADDWMAPWSGRLAPAELSLLGGEPALHPDLAAFVPLARRRFPAATIRIVTNGFLLARHPDLPRALADDGDAHLYLSVHHSSPEYRARLRPVLELLQGWREDHGVSWSRYRSFDRWTRRYHGAGADMRPFTDGDPRGSWEHCTARTCRQLYRGALWKCPPLAYLHLVDDVHALPDDWDPFRRYESLPPDCTDAALDAFLAREEEPACALCPASPERLQIPLPFRGAGGATA